MGHSHFHRSWFLCASIATVCQALTTTRPGDAEILINQSAEARQLLAQADGLANSRRWAAAARTYQRLIATHGNELLRVEDNHYSNATDLVYDRLTQWPDEAVAVYRSLSDEQATRESKALGESPTVASLLTFAEKWWFTQAGGRAAEQAARFLLERGRIQAAGQLFDRLSRFHPDFRARADAAVAAAFAFRLDGDTSRATEAAKRALAIGGELQWFGEALSVELALTRIAQQIAAGPFPGDVNTQPSSAPSVALADELLWQRDPRLADDAAALSTPLPWNDHVYVQGPSRLWSLRLNSGHISWAFPAEGDEAVQARSEPGGHEPACFAPCASDGYVFAVLAQREPHPLGRGPLRQGALLACLEANRGHQRWRTSAVAIAGGPASAAGADCSFDSSPIAHQGSVYVLIRRRVANTLVVHSLACLDPRTGQAEWQSDLVGQVSPTGADWQAGGNRLAAKGDTIHVWLRSGVLASVQADAGRVRSLTLKPLACDLAALGLSTSAPSVATVDGLAIVVTGGVIAASVPRGQALPRLEQAIVRRPDDPLAHLDLAAYALPRAPLAERGLVAIDTALTRADGAGIGEAIAHRALGVLLDAAVALSASGTTRLPETGPPIIDKLLERARRCARTPEERIRCRFTFADIYGQMRRPADAVRLCQEVLDDRQLRESRWPHRGRSALAGASAADRIDRLIATHGREYYARQDADAQALFAAARARSDRQALEEALARYPNALSKPDATLALANLECKAGAPLSAVRRLRELLDHPIPQRGTSSFDVPGVVRMIAEAYFDAGRPVEGLAWLARGQRDHPDARFAIDPFAGAATGRDSPREPLETFASLRRRRLADRETCVSRLPEISPPLERARNVPIDAPAILLQPATALFATKANNLALVYHNGDLDAFDSRTGQPGWHVPLAFTSPPTWLGTVEELVLLATRYQVLAVEAATGIEKWHFGTSPPGLAWPGVDPEVFTEMLGLVLDETRLVMVDEDGLATAVSVLDGRVLWERKLTHRFTGPMAMNDQYVVYASTVDQTTRLVVLDAHTGQDARTIDLDTGRHARWLEFTPARTVVVAGADWAACHEPDTASRLWQRPGQPFAGVQIGLAELCRLPAPGEIAAIALADGADLWRQTVVTDQTDVVLRTWLDAGDAFIVSTHALCALDLTTGQPRWRTTLPGGLVVDTALLATRFILVLTAPNRADRAARPPSSDHAAELLWIDRQTGHTPPTGRVALNPTGRVREAILLDGALWLQDDAGLTVWKGKLAPSVGQPTHPDR